MKNAIHIHSRLYSEVFVGYFKFSVWCDCRLVEHYVGADVLYEIHHFFINNFEIYSNFCGICIPKVPSILW